MIDLKEHGFTNSVHSTKTAHGRLPPQKTPRAQLLRPQDRRQRHNAATPQRIRCVLHDQTQGAIGNDPIYIGDPSKLRRVQRGPMKVKVREYAPSGSVRERTVNIKRWGVRLSSTESAVA